MYFALICKDVYRRRSLYDSRNGSDAYRGFGNRKIDRFEANERPVHGANRRRDLDRRGVGNRR